MKNNSNLGGLFYVQGKGGRMPVEEKTEQWETGEKVVEIELQDSIRKYGILNPLIVRPRPEGVYEIISGHRRKFAAEKLGYRKVPVIIRAMN